MLIELDPEYGTVAYYANVYGFNGYGGGKYSSGAVYGYGDYGLYGDSYGNGNGVSMDVIDDKLTFLELLAYAA